MAKASIKFALPFPPSANTLWRFDRGRLHLSSNYVRWQKQANEAAREQDLCRHSVIGRFTIAVKVSERFKKRGTDIDNRLKAVCDWCQRFGLIVDDSDCRKSSIEWSARIVEDCVVTLKGEIASGEYARLTAERRVTCTGSAER